MKRKIVNIVSLQTDRFMRIFSTVDTDSEMRIAAYRAMIRCPSEQLLQGIANVLAREPTHQGKDIPSSYDRKFSFILCASCECKGGGLYIIVVMVFRLPEVNDWKSGIIPKFMAYRYIMLSVQSLKFIPFCQYLLLSFCLRHSPQANKSCVQTTKSVCFPEAECIRKKWA